MSGLYKETGKKKSAHQKVSPKPTSLSASLIPEWWYSTKKLTNFEAVKKKMKSEKTEAENIEEEELKTVPQLLIPKSLMNQLEKNKH